MEILREGEKKKKREVQQGVHSKVFNGVEYAIEARRIETHRMAGTLMVS